MLIRTTAAAALAALALTLPSTRFRARPAADPPDDGCTAPSERRAYDQGRARAEAWLQSMFTTHLSCEAVERFVRGVRVSPFGGPYPQPRMCWEGGVMEGMNATVEKVMSACGHRCLQDGVATGVHKARQYCEIAANPMTESMSPVGALEPAVPLCSPEAAQACRAAFMAIVRTDPRCGRPPRSYAMPESSLSIRIEENTPPDTMMEEVLEKFCKPRS